MFGGVISTGSGGISLGLGKPLRVRKGLLPWDPLPLLPSPADISVVL